MGIFSGILLASDYDHTLTDENGHIPAANLNAIRHFITEGGRFTVASGRSVSLLRQPMQEVPFNAPCLCFNGAACYDFATESLLFADMLPQEIGPDFIEAARAFEPTLGIDLQSVTTHYSVGASSTREAFLRTQGIAVVRTEVLPPLPWIKIVFITGGVTEMFSKVLSPEESERMQRMEDYLRQHCGESCYIVRSMPRLLEVGAKQCNKGHAARELARRLGCHTLVGAGDAPNDRELLLEADISFVPSDGEESTRALPNVRLTAPCGEGAIAAAVAALEQSLK